MRKIAKISILILILFSNLNIFAEDLNIENAKEIVISAINDFGNNFLGDRIQYNIINSEYYHDDYIYVPGDRFYCNVIGKTINIEDAYYVIDNVNLMEPHDEELLVVIVSYYWAGIISQQSASSYKFDNFDRLVLNKYYLSKDFLGTGK